MPYNVSLNSEAMYTTIGIGEGEPRAPATCIPLYKLPTFSMFCDEGQDRLGIPALFVKRRVIIVTSACPLIVCAHRRTKDNASSPLLILGGLKTSTSPALMKVARRKMPPVPSTVSNSVTASVSQGRDTIGRG
jgi:hypothetical protein